MAGREPDDKKLPGGNWNQGAILVTQFVHAETGLDLKFKAVLEFDASSCLSRHRTTESTPARSRSTLES